MSTEAKSSVLLTLAQGNAWFLEQNLAGITPDESLRGPKPQGNTLNWVARHIVYWRRSIRSLLGAEPPGPSTGWELYDARAEGARPWNGSEALPFEELTGAFREAHQQPRTIRRRVYRRRRDTP